MKEPPLRNAIGIQVRKLRALKNWSQQHLAGRCNLLDFDIGRETVSQIERGVRGVSDLEMILLATVFQVELKELVPKKLPKWRKDLRPPNAVE